MFPNSHYEFILTPITKVLKDAVLASSGVGGGIETYPLYDYVMQSLFLKMTGFQEQKMKCICWDLATVDYEYRYEFTTKPLGECSNYKDKNKIYTDLIKQIEKCGLEFVGIGIDKNIIWTETFSDIEGIFSNSNLSIWGQRSFDSFKAALGHVNNNAFANRGALFEQSLQDIYTNHLYKQRNRIAHNTLSYQQNLPTLKNLINENHKYENYFVYFSVLVLIDKLFMELYKCYMRLVEEIN